MRPEFVQSSLKMPTIYRETVYLLAAVAHVKQSDIVAATAAWQMSVIAVTCLL